MIRLILITIVLWGIIACTIMIGTNTNKTHDADKTGILIEPEGE